MFKLNLVFLFSFLIFISSYQVSYAIYDPISVPNNRFGIHILETNELDKAKDLVNSSGGDWGYVTIPIRANDRDLPKWEAFMKQCRQLHLIPILRIATFPVSDYWTAPNEYDLIDFANFLDLLHWPTKNRYVIVFNEPNHKNEWGGFVYPEEYARVLSRALDILHKKNQDFFVISAGMDDSAPNAQNSMDSIIYLSKMEDTIPGILSQIDGISIHSYGNPGFETAPNYWSKFNVFGFNQVLNFLEYKYKINPKVFITEAGWRRDLVGDERVSMFYRQTFETYWTDKVVAVTPFLLSASAGPFEGFSFTDKEQNFYPFAKTYKDLPKVKGTPQMSEDKTITICTSTNSSNLSHKNSSPFSFDSIFSVIKGFFRL